MPMPRNPANGTHQCTFRLPSDLVARLDHEAQQRVLGRPCSHRGPDMTDHHTHLEYHVHGNALHRAPGWGWSCSCRAGSWGWDTEADARRSASEHLVRPEPGLPESTQGPDHPLQPEAEPGFRLWWRWKRAQRRDRRARRRRAAEWERTALERHYRRTAES